MTWSSGSLCLLIWEYHGQGVNFPGRMDRLLESRQPVQEKL
jgi:hypothetical protein